MATDSFELKIPAKQHTVIVYIVTGGLFATSCFLPATSIDSAPPDYAPGIGLGHLFFGFLSGVRGLPAWSANFILLVGLLCLMCSRFRAASILGVMAALLGLTTLNSFKKETMYIGYYFWQASLVFFAVGATVGYYRHCVDKTATTDALSE